MRGDGECHRGIGCRCRRLEMGLPERQFDVGQGLYG